MTPAPINLVSETVPAGTHPNTQPVAAKQQAIYAPPEDSADFSTKSQTRLRRYQSAKADSVSRVQGDSSKTRASFASVYKVKGSESQRAKLLKAQGDQIQQIAMELDVTPKAIEDCLDVTDNAATPSVAGLTTAG